MRKFVNWLPVILLVSACTPGNTPTEDTSTGKWWTATDRQLVLAGLKRTTEALREEIELLSEDQWNFREAADRWSIAEIVEHLEMQNQLHYREISVVANAPQYLKFRSITEGQDQYFSNYATDTTRSEARWFLQPLGRFGSKAKGEQAFYRARDKLTEFVEQTPIDLRKQFTFRTPVTGKQISELKIGQVRDLHQLLLTGIAHTDRHIRQIRNIKEHADFPE